MSTNNLSTIAVLSSIFLVSVTTPSIAGDVYKTTDAQGNTIYTDTPPATGAEPIDLPEPSTYAPVNSNFSPRISTPAKRPEVKYDSITITAPTNDETYRTGGVTLGVSLSPALQGDHTIQFLLNGDAVGEPSRSTMAAAGELFRGSYTVSANILNADGAVIGSSDSITFHVQRPVVGR